MFFIDISVYQWNKQQKHLVNWSTYVWLSNYTTIFVSKSFHCIYVILTNLTWRYNLYNHCFLFYYIQIVPLHNALQFNSYLYGSRTNFQYTGCSLTSWSFSQNRIFQSVYLQWTFKDRLSDLYRNKLGTNAINYLLSVLSSTVYVLPTLPSKYVSPLFLCSDDWPTFRALFTPIHLNGVTYPPHLGSTFCISRY